MKRAFNPGRNLYELYRKQPPARRGAAHAVAYWQGYDGLPNKHVPGSYAAWAWKAGRDNKAAEK
jgi:hypothetical protein